MPDPAYPTASRAWPLRLIDVLGRINRAVAIVCGVVLLAAMVLILAEIVFRQVVGRGIGGADEISGYVMAGIAAWGFSYALVERAHVRIDVVTGRLPLPGRSVFDLFALLALGAVAATVTIYGWSVLGTTLARGSRANTPLETPLWIPQTVWLSGWAWLTVVACLLAIATAALIARGRFSEAQAAIGVVGEVEGETP